MQKMLSREEIEAQLREKASLISHRLEAIESEVATVGESVKEVLFKNPWVSIGTSLLAGVAAGMVARKVRRHTSGVKDVGTHRQLVDAYVDAVVDHARSSARSGKEMGQAIRDALGDRVPLIVVAPSDDVKEEGFVRQAFNMAFSAFLGYAVRAGVDYMTQRLNLLAIADEVEAQDNLEDAKAAVRDEVEARTGL